MGNCWSEVKTRRLAAELDSRLEQGSLDDVKALLRRGAPVNGIRVDQNFISISETSEIAINNHQICSAIMPNATPHHYAPAAIQFLGINKLRVVTSLSPTPPDTNAPAARDKCKS